MRYVSLFLGVILLIFISFYNFGDWQYFDKDNDVVISENEYFVDKNYTYFKNYDDVIHNYTELLNYIYFVVNSGSTFAKGECTSEYKDCSKDLETIGNDKQLLSMINNFVHPYNSFESIVFTYNDKGKFSIKINKIYNDNEIKILNGIVSGIIKDDITDNMTTYDKIKVIHDYIIDTTKYDTLKSKNIKDTTYLSNTAYGVLVEGYGICSGYSDAMSIFLYKLGIENYKVSNSTHIWNLVKVNNVWLHLDLTWDDPIYESNLNRDTYFLITTHDLEKLNDNTHDFNKNIFKEAK